MREKKKPWGDDKKIVDEALRRIRATPRLRDLDPLEVHQALGIITGAMLAALVRHRRPIIIPRLGRLKVAEKWRWHPVWKKSRDPLYPWTVKVDIGEGGLWGRRAGRKREPKKKGEG